MREDFERILSEVNKGQCAELAINIDGKEYIRLFRPRERLIILGAGHISKALSNLGKMTDFEVVVVDDRPEYANEDRFPKPVKVICDDFVKAINNLDICSGDYIAIVTRAHKFDAECVRSIVSGQMPYYAGLLGSRRRTKVLVDNLEAEGYDRDKLEQIHTPIGLDIGAVSVEEIAVSIIAEIIAVRRSNMIGKGKSNIFTEEGFKEELVNKIVSDDLPKVLLMVIDTSGSTPVKSGSFMLVDEEGRTFGTIGGGSAENIAVTEAARLVGTGHSKVMDIDLTQDDGTDDAMLCGGRMKVLIECIS